jgi:hypothetical protein
MNKSSNPGATVAELGSPAPRIPLYAITPRKQSRPKGLTAYRPHNKTQTTIDRILALYERLHAADALPAGPRAVGYRLKELYVGEYTKDNFGAILDNIVRLQQAGKLPWNWVSDASAITYQPSGWPNPVSFLRDAHTLYQRDRREGQPVVTEIYTEARETLSLISRLGEERGVTVYSGGGSCGPNLAHKVAGRAVDRAIHNDQSTLILGVCDFDQAGIRNVLRPHIEHLAAFVYGTSGNTQVLATQNGHGLLTVDETDAAVSFRHLALTPEQAHDLVETEQDRQGIGAYIASGTDLWSRDLACLDAVQKVETEALDPVALRDMVVAALDTVIDNDTLGAVDAEETAERADLESRLGGVADTWTALRGGDSR